MSHFSFSFILLQKVNYFYKILNLNFYGNFHQLTDEYLRTNYVAKGLLTLYSLKLESVISNIEHKINTYIT